MFCIREYRLSDVNLEPRLIAWAGRPRLPHIPVSPTSRTAVLPVPVRWKAHTRRVGPRCRHFFAAEFRETQWQRARAMAKILKTAEELKQIILDRTGLKVTVR